MCENCCVNRCTNKNELTLLDRTMLFGLICEFVVDIFGFEEAEKLAGKETVNKVVKIANQIYMPLDTEKEMEAAKKLYVKMANTLVQEAEKEGYC